MKNKTTLLMIFCVAFYSCTIEDTNIDLTDNLVVTNEDNSRRIEDTPDCVNEIELIAAQNFTAGIVSYEIVDGVLVVTYDTGDTGWVIDATHLWVGLCGEDDLPTNNPGNPLIGQFPYKSTHSPGVTKVELPPITDYPSCGCIAAHAEVSLLENGNVIQEETAWAFGTPFDGNSWAMYFEYCDDDCGVVSNSGNN